MPPPAPAALRPSSVHAPSYYAATVKEHVATQPFAGSARTNVCVVGGGYTGLSTALHLARRGVEVTLLEQSRLGWGASGRNGGQAHVGMRRDQEWLEQHVGLADAHRLWEFALNARAHLDWLIENYAIDCDLRLGHLHANHRERYTAETRHHVEYLRSKYGMTPDDYRAKWGLPADYPMVAPNYAAKRSEFAKQIGLGLSSPRKAKKR